MNLNLEKKEDVLKLQEIVANNLKQGQVPEKEIMNFYEQIKKFDLPKNEAISKNSEFLKNHYEKFSLEEQFVVNNLLFVLEMLNGNAKEGLKDYVKRTLLFYTHAMANNLEAEWSIEFIKKINEPDLILETVSDLFEHYFDYEYQKRRAIIANTLVIIWNNQYLYNSKKWLKIFNVLVRKINEAIEKELIEDEMPLHFLAYHIYGNNIQTIDEWRVFNKKIEKPASEFFKKWGEKHNLSKCKSEISKGKKKIGFLIDRIVLNSPFMVFYSLIKNLMSDEEFKKNYEIYVYSMEYIYKQMDDENLIRKLSALGVKVYTPAKFRKDGYYFSHLQKALDLRNRIIGDEIDYLIGGGGYDIPIFLYANRSAPRQIFWSHGNCVSDLIGIDKRISHFAQECNEWEWEIFNVPMAEEFLVGSEDDKKKGEAIKKALLEEFGGDTVILGTIGRLVKINSEEYLEVIKEIMDKNPNTIYLACGAGNREEIEEKIEKLGIDRNRFIFAGHVNPHQFGWVIDIWPDSFPLLQGQSRNEYQAKGGAIAVLKKHYPKAAFEKMEKLAKKLNTKNPIVENIDEYISFINELIKDKNLKEIQGKLNREWIKEDFKYQAFIRTIS